MFSFPDATPGRPGLTRPLRRYTVPLAALLAVVLVWTMPTNALLWDALNRALPSPPDARVVVVGIDDATLRDYGRIGNWPRELYGQALNTLEQAGAAAIGIDVLLGDPARNDAALAAVFSRPNVVLATAPGEATTLRPDWRSPTGVSALNLSEDGIVRSFQTAYPAPDAPNGLAPSFARQLAVAAGRSVPLDTHSRILRYSAPDPQRLPVIPFRDVVNGTIRYGDIQNRVVVLGLTASGVPGPAVRDVTGQPVSGVELQARAVSSLLSPPFTSMPLWTIALVGVLAAVSAALAGGLWGFWIALLALALSVPYWLFNTLLPGVTLSMCAVLGSGLVMLERWWALRHSGVRDPLTGFGNRLAFTRAIEGRWQGRHNRPLGLLLVDLSGFRKVNATYGHAAGDELLRELAGRIMEHKRRGDLIFRWGPDEFAVLLYNMPPAELADLTRRVQLSLDAMSYRDLPLRASVGGASTGPEINSPTDLIEAASRSRYRIKYQREQWRE
ncbi:CHASE2 domain-containing protein [Deinococcus humi]|uniref:Diguanylate cyclase (GGDEF)-like protein n=1 Tax=Deinococcus humi TaxID=662880 RepID=A0A7W8NFI1_9DEIO|nr:CHASE2 domain-containing protein [Deinococcus humi]MBB5361997.1 diguanylate cyclase (GGDEF)-like protein [Deinococcus humi]GGO22590.1 diguanylate cyclase [Deinococcus humi]